MIYIFHSFQSTSNLGWPPQAWRALVLWPERISEPVMVRVTCTLLENFSIFLSPCEVTLKGLPSLFSNSLCGFLDNFYYLYYLTLILQGNCISISPLYSKFIENRLYLLIFTSQMPRTVAGTEETFSTCLMNDWNDLSKITVKKNIVNSRLKSRFYDYKSLVLFPQTLAKAGWLNLMS